MSLLRRLWQRFRNPTYFVGRDLEGNSFYEHPSVSDDPRRTKRTVKYKHGDDMWDYVAGSRRLPVQWVSWMTHTRLHPPTLEELQADLERRRRVQFNAALIEVRDQEERARQQQLTATLLEALPSPPVSQASPPPPPSPTQVPPPAQSHPPVQTRSESTPSQPATISQTNTEGAQADSQSPSSNPWKSPPPSDEPQPWSPKVIRRS